jgi:8-oxo-dGTP pyrophosphatase MutT (NUDIX family)
MIQARSREPRRLDSLIPADAFVGTSLILRRRQPQVHQRNKLLYGIRPPLLERSRHVLELTGIGGGIEEADASLTAGVLREAHEEIGCHVCLLPCQETVVVHGPHHVEHVALHGDERPAAVVLRGHRTPPHQPWHPTGRGEACLIVFLAEFDERPQPKMELAALLWLRPEHVVAAARHDVPLSTLLGTGAELVERAECCLPDPALARLTDSQEALVLALGEAALAFYQAMLEG